jgi:psiF repeat
MKLISALALSALLSTTAAFAQTTASAPANASPTTSVTPANGKPTVASCKKLAADKKLTGADKTQFMKDCQAGKPTN